MTLDDLDIESYFVQESVILARNSRSSGQFIHGIKVLMARNYGESNTHFFELEEAHLFPREGLGNGEEMLSSSARVDGRATGSY